MGRLIPIFLTLCAIACPVTAYAADDHRVSFLEREVRDLRNQVLALTRRVDEATTRPIRPGTRPAPAAVNPSRDSDKWVDAKKWAALRPGMSELEVISALGKPTSMRDEDGARVMFYALEIGASGFLGGSVWFRDRVVSEVRAPSLQ
jgi:hypothetical protein